MSPHEGNPQTSPKRERGTPRATLHSKQRSAQEKRPSSHWEAVKLELRSWCPSRALGARVRVAAAVLLLGVVAAVYPGCSDPPQPPPMKGESGAGQGSEILSGALAILESLERYNIEQIELFACPQCNTPYPRKPALVGKPFQCQRCGTVFTVPELDRSMPTQTIFPFNVPQTLSTLVDRLNQWVGRESTHVAWQADPMLQELPAEFRSQVSKLNAPRFQHSGNWPAEAQDDGWALLEVMWLRDAAHSASGETVDPLARAGNLFDWTVRQVQLEDATKPVSEDAELKWSELPLRPWQILLLGRGLAVHRAWVFCLLARQEGIPVVLLQPEKLDYPLAAAVTDEGLFLFDPQLGLPLPGPDGKGIATLAQAAEDSAVLRQLDLEGHPYPLTVDDLKDVTALIEASPVYLSQRMAQLGANYVGQRPVLAIAPSNIAQRVKKLGVAKAKLWEFPYQTFAQLSNLDPGARGRFDRLLLPFTSGPRGSSLALLFNGRSLHIRGVAEGERNAYQFYSEVRPPDKMISDAPLAGPDRRLLQITKAHATYWLGLLTAAQGDYRASIDHLDKRTLHDPDAAMWANGARLNLALAWQARAAAEPAEAKDYFSRAIDVLEQYASEPLAKNPNAHGNLLRAKWMRAQRDAVE